MRITVKEFVKLGRATQISCVKGVFYARLADQPQDSLGHQLFDCGPEDVAFLAEFSRLDRYSDVLRHCQALQRAVKLGLGDAVNEIVCPLSALNSQLGLD